MLFFSFICGFKYSMFLAVFASSLPTIMIVRKWIKIRTSLGFVFCKVLQKTHRDFTILPARLFCFKLNGWHSLKWLVEEAEINSAGLVAWSTYLSPWPFMSMTIVAVMLKAVCVCLSVGIMCVVICICLNSSPTMLQGLLVPWPIAQIIVIMTHLSYFAPSFSKLRLNDYAWAGTELGE